MANHFGDDCHEKPRSRVPVALYNLHSREHFGSGSGYYQGKQAEIVNGSTTVVFPDIPDGIYALAAFHDLDRRGAIRKKSITTA